MESTDAHLKDDEQGRERRMMILDAKSDSFAMQFLQKGIVGTKTNF
jgi:hypothetical protein